MQYIFVITQYMNKIITFNVSKKHNHYMHYTSYVRQDSRKGILERLSNCKFSNPFFLTFEVTVIYPMLQYKCTLHLI